MVEKLTEARIKANKKWDEKNKERTSYLRSRSSAKSFIKNKATKEDIDMLKDVMKDRLNDLKGV
ncbi:hypothetical protein [Companilactobacillus musae]|uniref:hypothetical protein n=1 Tax=Companilactobacillus musae TaxID=1903258 RepID=UPI000E651628|nr:hypothetical protein [Companilactobacillus musae]